MSNLLISLRRLVATGTPVPAGAALSKHSSGDVMSILSSRSIRTAALFVSAIATCSSAFAAASIDPPQAEQVMSTTASGVQVYSCEYDAQHHLAWVFKSPLATLYDTSGQAVIKHAAGPSWQADDGSRIVGHVLAQTPSATAESIPQLLLETHSAGASGTLSNIRYVQRINTVGGLMPAAACTAEHQTGSSPYIANYAFYK